MGRSEAFVDLRFVSRIVLLLSCVEVARLCEMVDELWYRARGYRTKSCGGFWGEAHSLWWAADGLVTVARYVMLSGCREDQAGRDIEGLSLTNCVTRSIRSTPCCLSVVALARLPAVRILFGDKVT